MFKANNTDTRTMPMMSFFIVFISVCLPACLPACLPDWLAGWLAVWLTEWLAVWVAVWLAGWPADWLTDWLHGLTCVVSRVRVLHSFIVTSTSTLGIEWATPCNPILFQQYFQAFKLQIISYTFQPRVPTTAPRVTPSYNCLVYLFWPCDWIRILNMAITTKTPASQYIFYATQTQSTS